MKLLNSLTISFLILITSLPNTTNAQSIIWGTAAKANKATGWVYSLGWHEGSYYTIEMEKAGSMKMGGKLRFEKLSNNMSLGFSKVLDVGMTAFSEAEFQIVDGELKIYSLQGQAFKDIFIYCDTYSLNGVKKNRKEVTKVPKRKCSNSYYTSNEFSFSPNKKHVVWSSICTDDKLNKYEFSSLIFDANGENLKRINTEFSVEGKLSNVYFNQLEIDNSGHTIISYNVSQTKPTENYSKLLILNNEGEIVLDKKLDFDEFFLGRIKLELSKNSEVYMTGLLGTTVDGKSSYGGFFMAKLNATTYELDKFQSFPYSEEFFLSLGYKIKKDGRVKFYGSYSLDIILNDNGGGFLVANHKQGYKSTGTTDKELVVLPFSSELVMESPMVVPRSLNSYPPLLNGLGYLGFCKNDKLYLVYTDHVKNINNQSFEDIEAADNPKDSKAAIYIATVESGTSVKRKIIARENKIKGYLIPRKSNADQDNIVISVGNKANVLYGRIKL